jgi:glycosyltransferase involved in cell wall biosynthesis
VAPQALGKLNMTRLSLCIITKNEAQNLARCIESVPCADEIVVVDSGSDDGTPELARELGARVFDLPWRGFGAAKQAALDRATGQWVLSLDADEALDESLATEVARVRDHDSEIQGYRLRRISNFLGTWIRHSGWYPDPVLRLARRKAMRFTPDRVHERVLVQGAVADLDGHLLHFTDPDLRHYLEKLCRYADLSAQALNEKGRRARVRDFTIRPAYQFMRTYFLQRGFMDGVAGVILAGGSAFHVFSKYARLWDIQRERT